MTTLFVYVTPKKVCQKSIRYRVSKFGNKIYNWNHKILDHLISEKKRARVAVFRNYSSFWKWIWPEMLYILSGHWNELSLKSSCHWISLSFVSKMVAWTSRSHYGSIEERSPKNIKILLSSGYTFRLIYFFLPLKDWTSDTSSEFVCLNMARFP